MKKRLGIKGVVKHEGRVEGLILFLREERVLLDADLAKIYGITTKALNQAVKRNAERFPNDFMFQLSDVEKQEVVTNCDHLTRLKYSNARPYAFTEHGALMVASVLNSNRAIAMSIYVIKAFVKMREELMANETFLRRLAEVDQTLLMHDEGLRDLYEKLMPLLEPEPEREERKIGF